MPLYCLTACAALAIASFVAQAEDWPAWTGPLGRNVALESNLPADFDRDTGRNIKWVVELGDVAFGCPTVSEGRVFIGTNLAALRDDPRFDALQGGVLACLDEATGKPLWYLVTPVRIEGFPPDSFVEEQRWGICSSPTVDGDRVYVITNGDDLLCLDVNGLRDGNDGPVQDEASYCAGEGGTPLELRDTDADILWRYDIPRELSVAPHDVASGSVLIRGEILYASTSNGIGRYRKDGATDAVNPHAPACIALNKHTGTLIATDDTPISRELFHAQWASPSTGLVAGRHIVAVGGSDGVCYAFDPIDDASAAPNDGKLETRWSFDANPHHYRFAADGTPINYAAGDYRWYQRREQLNQSIEAFNADAGKEAIDRRVAISTFNNSDGTYVGPSEILATPIFYREKVYILTGRDPLHGLGKGALSCIDATKSGDISEAGLRWRFEDIGRSMSSVAVENDLVYAADLAGQIYCLDANTGALHWQHDTKDEIWGNPLVADGKVYINARRSFWILATGKEKQMLFTSRGGSECGPIAANGVVYAFIRGNLYAIVASELPQGRAASRDGNG